jgi:hypothetical protein
MLQINIEARTYVYLYIYIYMHIYIYTYVSVDMHVYASGWKTAASVSTATSWGAARFPKGPSQGLGAKIWRCQSLLQGIRIWQWRWYGNSKDYVTGWWLSHPSEKYEFVSWDYYSQYMEKIKNVPNHQPEMVWKFQR